MHIPPYDNRNRPIVEAGGDTVPLCYFNTVRLKRGEEFAYSVPGYETCIVPATGTVSVEVSGATFPNVGNRTQDVWDGEPEGVYVPCGPEAVMSCESGQCEVFVAGARYGTELEPFAVRAGDLDVVQYGSDDTKTHRKIKHILGPEAARPGRTAAGLRTLHGRQGRLVRVSVAQARHRSSARGNPARRDIQFPVPAEAGFGTSDAAAERGRTR